MVRSEIVRVRLSVEEKAALARLCEGGRTESEVIRLLFRDRCSLPLPLSAADHAVLSANAAALDRIGAELRLVVRRMNEGSQGFEPAMFAALTAVLDEADVLRRVVSEHLQSAPLARRNASRDV